MRTENASTDEKNYTNESGMSECIDNCLNCYKTCLETISSAYTQPDHNHDLIIYLANCARICQTSAEFMISGSHLHTITCRACSEVCEHCYQECEKMDDSSFKQCGEVCRKCADSCRMMAAH